MPTRNYTPVGEDVAPPYYFTVDSTHWNKPTNPCSPYGQEDHAGSALGLDNDGDGAYDMADPDCGGLCSAVGCPPTGNPCTINVCDPADGLCKEQNRSDYTSCSDGLFCTDGDRCVSGVCTPGGPRNCDDGLFCTGGETCNEATDSCESSGNPCAPATEICDEMTDSCTPL